MTQIAFRPPSPPLSEGVVQLRIWHPDDLDQLVAGVQDPEVTRWTLVPEPYTEADGEQFLASVPDEWRTGRGAVFCINPADEASKVIGGIGLFTTGPGVARIGYWVALEARRRGVGARAVRLLCRWAFDEVGLARIEADVIPGNDASMRTLESVGFVREGLLRSGILQRGVRLDGVLFGLLPDDLSPGSSPG
jgi:RimJ/RimL family protein N-acetyltransferase